MVKSLEAVAHHPFRSSHGSHGELPQHSSRCPALLAHLSGVPSKPSVMDITPTWGFNGHGHLTHLHFELKPELPSYLCICLLISWAARSLCKWRFEWTKSSINHQNGGVHLDEHPTIRVVWKSLSPPGGKQNKDNNTRLLKRSSPRIPSSERANCEFKSS